MIFSNKRLSAMLDLYFSGPAVSSSFPSGGSGGSGTSPTRPTELDARAEIAGLMTGLTPAERDLVRLYFLAGAEAKESSNVASAAAGRVRSLERSRKLRAAVSEIERAYGESRRAPGE
jgi:DNA-directed RNA polymerase specialized sigma24 family protein